MIVSRKNRDKLLGLAAIITFLIGGINAFEFFLANKEYLYTKTGTIEKIDHDRYESGRKLYSKTTIRLKDVNGKFYVTDDANDGGYIELNEGDTITVYARKFLQVLYNYNYRSNLYYVEKDGKRVYNNLSEWKAAAFLYMCIGGGCALLLLVMYLDQVKNISISNWFQRKFLNKQNNSEA